MKTYRLALRPCLYGEKLARAPEANFSPHPRAAIKTGHKRFSLLTTLLSNGGMEQPLTSLNDRRISVHSCAHAQESSSCHKATDRWSEEKQTKIRSGVYFIIITYVRSHFISFHFSLVSQSTSSVNQSINQSIIQCFNVRLMWIC